MHHPITVRTAVPNDQKALEALQWRASLNNPGDRDDLIANPDAIEVPLQQIEAGGVFVAEVDNAIRGFAAILTRHDGNSQLDALFVEPESWRQGIGRVLVEYCCMAAMAAGASEIHVLGNPHAEGFYGKCGFKTLGKEQTRFGVGLLMKRGLL
jgi:GNAT superfamily N-acetyltransferase